MKTVAVISWWFGLLLIPCGAYLIHLGLCVVACGGVVCIVAGNVYRWAAQRKQEDFKKQWLAAAQALRDKQEVSAYERN